MAKPPKNSKKRIVTIAEILLKIYNTIIEGPQICIFKTSKDLLPNYFMIGNL